MHVQTDASLKRHLAWVEQTSGGLRISENTWVHAKFMLKVFHSFSTWLRHVNMFLYWNGLTMLDFPKDKSARCMELLQLKPQGLVSSERRGGWADVRPRHNAEQNNGPFPKHRCQFQGTSNYSCFTPLLSNFFQVKWTLQPLPGVF